MQKQYARRVGDFFPLIAVHSVMAGAAMAQDSGVSGSIPQDPAAASAVDNVIVTARRREENLQDTPISITAYSGAELKERGLNNVSEAGAFTPNVRFNASIPVSGNNASMALFIRGIGQNDFQVSADPGVGLYLDGVYISRSVGNMLELLNVERMEVLRGPQGTLFGRNTIGGAVSITTVKPGDEFSGLVEAETGRFGRYSGRLSVDVPVTDTLYTNLTGFFRYSEGYVKGAIPGAPDLGNHDDIAGRFAARWVPNDRLEVNLTLDGSRQRSEPAPVVAISIDDTAPAAAYYNAAFSGAPGVCADPANPARLNDPRCYNEQWVLGPFRHAGTFTTFNEAFNAFGGFDYEAASEIDVWGVSGTVDYDLNDAMALKFITAYRRVDGFWPRDSDHSPANIVQSKNDWKQEQFSQEVQLAGSFLDGAVNWVLGGYYAAEDADHLDVLQIVDAAFGSRQTLDARSIAGFGQVTWDVTDRLSLTGGARWTEDRKSLFPDQSVIVAGFTAALTNPVTGLPIAAGDLILPLQRETIRDSDWTPMASVSYRWTDGLMTYASYSQGFKGGGFTGRVFPPLPVLPSFEPETSTTYEIGFKSDLLDRRLRLNGALFQNDYEDLQITVLDPVIGFAPIIQNAAQAEIRGGELEFILIPINNLTLAGGVGYLDAEYTEIALGSFTTEITTDNQLQSTPEWTATMSAEYAIDTPVGVFTPRADWAYTSSVFHDVENSPLLRQDAYHLLNIALLFRDKDDRWNVRVGLTNVLDEAYLTSGFVDNFAGVVEGTYGRPREWILKIGRNF